MEPDDRIDDDEDDDVNDNNSFCQSKVLSNDQQRPSTFLSSSNFVDDQNSWSSNQNFFNDDRRRQNNRSNFLRHNFSHDFIHFEPLKHTPALNERYESLDYEMIENKIYRNQQMSPEHQLNLWRMSINRWIVCFLIGVITALIACFVDVFVIEISKIKFTSIGNAFEEYLPKRQMYKPILIWIGINCILVAVAAGLVLFLSGPVASGSGIPQVKCFLNGIQIPGVVRLKTLVAKVLGVSCSVAGGLAVGKEGPMIHSGAVVAAGISQGRCITYPLDFKLFEYFRNDREKRDFVCAGAAAGVAAAFGAPIGGVLFSLEEGASFISQSLTWRTFFSSTISSFTLSIVMSLIKQRPGLLSWSGLVNFGTFENVSYKIWEIFIFIFMGAFGGLTGALFNCLSVKLTIFRTRFIKKSWQKFLEALMVAAASASLAIFLLYSIPDCKTIKLVGVNDHHENNRMETVDQMWCPDGKYSATSRLFFNSPEECVKLFFHSPKNSFSPGMVAIFALSYFVLSIWTYGLPVPSGLFIPCLLTGAAWGHLVGIGMQMIFPDTDGMASGKYALAGAAAQLGGVVRMTISLCAILIESTHEITFALPIMLILMTSKWVGDFFTEGIYDMHIHLAEVPILEWEPPYLAANVPAIQVMCPKVITLTMIEKVGRVFEILRSCRHNAFPIVDDVTARELIYGGDVGGGHIDQKLIRYGRLRGLISRYQLITLLQHKIFSEDKQGSCMISTDASLSPKDFRDAYPRYRVALEHISLTSFEKDCWLDFRPYMNASPHRVSQDSTLTILFYLFRNIGLRHVVVVDHDNRVIGIVTRKDLARFKSTRYKNQYAVRELYFSPSD